MQISTRASESLHFTPATQHGEKRQASLLHLEQEAEPLEMEAADGGLRIGESRWDGPIRSKQVAGGNRAALPKAANVFDR